MKKIIYVIYGLCILTALVFFLYLCARVSNIEEQTRTDSGYYILDGYEKKEIEDSTLPVGTSWEYLFRLPEVGESGVALMFHTSHQSVSVFVDGEQIYQFKPNPDNPFGKTSGYKWNIIPLYHSDEGKEIRVVVIPNYKSVANAKLDFYVGSKYQIRMHILKESIVLFALSGLAIILGLVFIGFTLVSYRSTGVNKGLMLGIFAVFIGLWQIFDSDGIAILCSSAIHLSYITFLSLLLLVVPFLLFLKELFVRSEALIWYILCFSSIIVFFITLILQVLDIADMRQTLWLNHMVMLGIVAGTLVMFIKEVHTNGWTKMLKMTALCIAGCILGLIADLIVYYLSHGTKNKVIGMIGFLIYMFVLGVIYIRESRDLMAIGMKARQYEEMAYHDHMTGLYNRAAYASHTGESFQPEDTIVILFDLNNLKKCNDTRGHEAGDEYIIKSTEFIREAFHKLGNCYRMGGDEFCVLVKKRTVEECQKALDNMRQLAADYNNSHEETFPIQIASGMAQYDRDLDFDFGDTLRRADKQMYQDKFRLKHPLS